MGDACGRETTIGRVTPHIRRVIQRMPLGSDRIRMLGGLDFTKEFVLKTCANDQKLLIAFLLLASMPVSAQISRETLAKKTTINGPTAVALDHDGHLFVVEEEENRIRR